MGSESYRWIAPTENERHGLEYNRHLRGLFDTLEEYRGLTMAFASGDAAMAPSLARVEFAVGQAVTAVDRVDRELGGRLRTRARWEALRARWLGLKDAAVRLPPREGFHAQTALIADVLALITHVGDTSNLITDPDLDCYYLMDTLIARLLRVVELLGHTRALGASIATRRAATVEERIHLPALVGETRAAVSATDRGLRVAFDVNPALRPRLEKEPGGVRRGHQPVPGNHPDPAARRRGDRHRAGGLPGRGRPSRDDLLREVRDLVAARVGTPPAPDSTPRT